MRPPWPLAAALCLCLLLAATPGSARVELPPGQDKSPAAAAERGGRPIPGAARKAAIGCAPAASMLMFGLGWWAPFPFGGCLGLQQIEQQARFTAGAQASVLAGRQSPRAARLAAQASKRAFIQRQLGNRPWRR